MKRDTNKNSGKVVKKSESKKPIQEIIDDDNNPISGSINHTSGEISTNPDVYTTKGLHPQFTDDYEKETGEKYWQYRFWGFNMREGIDNSVKKISAQLRENNKIIEDSIFYTNKNKPDITPPQSNIPNYEDLDSVYQAPQIKIAVINLIREFKKLDQTDEKTSDILAIILKTIMANGKQKLDNNFKKEIAKILQQVL